MILFTLVLLGLIGGALAINLISNMKIVGGNELGIVSGRGKKGFHTFSGGRIFIIPLFNNFSTIDLTPHTIEVIVDSAIAEGVVPLNVKATVSFAISSNEAGRNRAVTRILSMAGNIENLRHTAASIIEGHLRDAIASMTPEQVMTDKDTLVARMINVCKTDLENIGLEITTMNIADVDDHRLEGVEEPDLYIALLKRIQTANAEAQARQAQADARASAEEERELRRADTEVRNLENLYENLVAETRVKIATEIQRKTVGIEKAKQSAAAQVAGLKAQLESEKQNIERLGQQYSAEIVIPAEAQRDKMILQARSKASLLKGTALGEMEQLAKTLEIIEKSGESGRLAYILENFSKLSGPFSQTLNNFPVHTLTVMTGAGGHHEPLSAIHPHAVDEARNRMIAGALEGVTRPEKK